MNLSTKCAIIHMKLVKIKKMNEKLYLTFRALRHRNYRLFFLGQCISLIGTWIQQVAMSWLVYSLTKSALLMGIITFASSLPSLLVSPFAGVLIDRVNKRRTLMLIQSLFMVETFVLAILAISGVVQVWHIIVLGVLMGITNAIDMPLRQAFVVQLVDDSEDLSNAISLNSSSFNLARLIGPAIAGVLIASVGEGICFLLNALSYIAVIWAIFLMKINSAPTRKSTKSNMLHELKEGFSYALYSKPIRTIIFYIAASSLLGMSFFVIMPIFAKEILHGNAQTLGFLMSSSGIGALIGALYLAAKKSSVGMEKWIYFASLLCGVGLVGLNSITKLWMALIGLFIIGMGVVIIIACCNTLIQNLVDDDKRGRVMSLYTMAFMGTMPFGSLLEGAIADRIGVPYTFLLNGFALIIAAFIFRTKLKYFDVKTEETVIENEVFSEPNSHIPAESPAN